MNRRNAKLAGKAVDALFDKLDQRQIDKIKPTVEEGEHAFDTDESPGLNWAQRMQFSEKLKLAHKGGKITGPLPDPKDVTYGQARAIFEALGLDPKKLSATPQQKAWLKSREESK